MVSHPPIATLLMSDALAFGLLWLLIWVLAIVLAVSGGYIYYKYRENRKSRKRKDGDT